MDFSEAYRISSIPPAFSPDGKYIATAVEYRLVIREVESLRVVQLYSCLDKIHHMEWSCTSTYVLCLLKDRGIVQVWSVDDPDWTCKIDDGPAGIQHASWSSDGQSIIVIADFQIRMTVWSLVDRSCKYLKGPKHAAKGMAFSPDGEYLAVLERKECKDYVSLYQCSSWQQLKQFQVDTADAADLQWSPDGSTLAVWDTILTYRVFFYTADGAGLGRYAAYNDALGIRQVTWSPAGEFVAVGSFDQVARVLNNVTWQPTLEASHPAQLQEPCPAVVYQEVEELRTAGAAAATGAGAAAAGASSSQRGPECRAKYVICKLPAELRYQQAAPDKPNPKMGVNTVAWSHNSRYLATLNDSTPGAAWVWDLLSGGLAAVLHHVGPVKRLRWAPKADTLAITTGTGRVYLWSPAGASVVHIPLRGFAAQQLQWSPEGDALVLCDREAFCCAYVAGN